MTRSDEAYFQSATPVLKASDYPRTRAFFLETLGFTLCEEGGDPPRFGIFQRGQSIVFIDAWHGGPKPVPGTWDAYIHVVGLNALFDELSKAGAAITRPVESTVYGMREFEVTDPDGNVICFGEDEQPEAGA